MPLPMRDLVGQRFGRLVVQSQADDTFTPNGQKKRNWICQCDCGGQRSVPATTLLNGSCQSCGCLLRETNSGKRTQIITYEALHNRIRRDRGSARNLACVDCGEGAHEWSYDHEDPKETTGFASGLRPVRFSMNDAHYEPRCRSCHRKFDQRAAGY